MIAGCLWHAGDVYTQIKHSLDPVRSPVPVSVLALDVDTRHKTECVYARVDAGELIAYSEVGCVASVIRQSYAEAGRTGMPLIVVVLKERNDRRPRNELRQLARAQINAFKSDELKRNVAIPRLLTLPGDTINRHLFNQRAIDSTAQLTLAESILGAPLGDAHRLARPIVVATTVSNSQLGVEAAPVSYVNRYQGTYAK